MQCSNTSRGRITQPLSNQAKKNSQNRQAEGAQLNLYYANTSIRKRKNNTQVRGGSPQPLMQASRGRPTQPLKAVMHLHLDYPKHELP